MKKNAMYGIGLLLSVVFLHHLLLVAVAAPSPPNSYCAAHKLPHLAGIEADNSRSDTIDVLHYDLILRLTSLTTTAELLGECTLSIVPRINNLNQVLLDLEDLTVTGIEVNGLPADYVHSSTLLRINLSTPANPTDTLQVRVQYHGNPPTASFGGFYFVSGYAYNLGIGIGVNPPSYGRAWFPCIDNFIDRATYTCHITTQSTRKAFCGGILEDISYNPDNTTTWHWNLHQAIPTYLASVAVSQYETLEWAYYGVADTIPVQIGVRAADTTDLKASFIHLPECITAFEHAYGPYRFDRIGYVVVPFNGGAMEHATNIAYPQFAIDGTLAWESLMSHEFSHHWFGDLVTCETASDMWLNEGWASYSAQYFLEAVYGKDRYLDEVRNNHDKTMTLAHITDGAHLPVAGVPFDATYGEHVYNKGADVAHTLRGYMGDTLFFSCLQQYLDAYAFSTANTDQFRDYLSTCSGMDFTNYFDDWVKQPGWAHFSLSKFQVDDIGGYVAYVIRERSYANPNIYHHVPLEITFFDQHFNRYTTSATTGTDSWGEADKCTYFDITPPFEPVYTALDFDEKINDASTDYHRFITTTGQYDFPTTRVTVTVDSLSDTTLLRIIHNRVAPDSRNSDGDGLVPNDILLSPNRYWTVEGYNQGIFEASASFVYNGSNSTTSGGYLDNNLITGNEANLRLLHRSNRIYGGTTDSWDEHWTIVSDAVLVTGSSTTDKRGSFTVPHLQYGEYTLGYFDPMGTDTTSRPIPCITLSTNIQEPAAIAEVFSIQPNPSKTNFSLVFKQNIQPNTQLSVYNATGNLVYQAKVLVGKTDLQIDTHAWQNGIYMVCLHESKTAKGCAKVAISH